MHSKYTTRKPYQFGDLLKALLASSPSDYGEDSDDVLTEDLYLCDAVPTVCGKRKKH